MVPGSTFRKLFGLKMGVPILTKRLIRSSILVQRQLLLGSHGPSFLFDPRIFTLFGPI